MSGPTTVVGRDLASGEVTWQTRRRSPPRTRTSNYYPYAIWPETLLVLVSGNDLTAYEVTTGAAAWPFSLPTSPLLDGVGVIDGGGLVVQASGCKYRVVNRGSGPVPAQGKHHLYLPRKQPATRCNEPSPQSL